MSNAALVYNECPSDSLEPRKGPYDWYRWRYLCLWLVPMSFFTAGLVFLILGILFSTPHSSSAHGIVDTATNSTLDAHPERAAYAFPLMVFFFAAFAWMRGSAQQLRYRIGMGLFSGLGGVGSDAAPITIEAVPDRGVAAARIRCQAHSCW